MGKLVNNIAGAPLKFALRLALFTAVLFLSDCTKRKFVAETDGFTTVDGEKILEIDGIPTSDKARLRKRLEDQMSGKYTAKVEKLTLQRLDGTKYTKEVPIALFALPGGKGVAAPASAPGDANATATPATTEAAKAAQTADRAPASATPATNVVASATAGEVAATVAAPSIEATPGQMTLEQMLNQSVNASATGRMDLSRIEPLQSCVCERDGVMSCLINVEGSCSEPEKPVNVVVNAEKAYGSQSNFLCSKDKSYSGNLTIRGTGAATILLDHAGFAVKYPMSMLNPCQTFN